MYLECISDSSKKYYGKPVMVLNISENSIQNFSDEEILKRFSEDDETEAIVIIGSDPMDKVDALRSFMFSARKFFSPNSRPRIIIFTKYFAYELERKSWHGAQYELMYYGNAILNCGRLSIKKNKSQFDIIKYNGLQHS